MEGNALLELLYIVIHTEQFLSICIRYLHFKLSALSNSLAVQVK